MGQKSKITAERFVNPFADLSHANHVLLENAREQRPHHRRRRDEPEFRLGHRQRPASAEREAVTQGVLTTCERPLPKKQASCMVWSFRGVLKDRQLERQTYSKSVLCNDSGFGFGFFG